MRKGGRNPTAGFTRWQTGCGEWTSSRKPGRRSAATAGPPGWTGRHRRQWGVRRGAVARGTVTRKRLRQWLCRKPGPGKGGTRATRMKGCWEPMACRPLRRRPGAFRGRGHDPSESRMRENRTSGLTGGGEETRPRWGIGHRHRAKAAGQQPLPAPTAGRASPRLYGGPSAYQYLIPVTYPIPCHTAWHANRTSTFPSRYGRPGGAACIDGGRSGTSPARGLCERGRWHDPKGKPGPGSARSILGKPDDRVGVSPHPAAARWPTMAGDSRGARMWLARGRRRPGRIPSPAGPDGDGRGSLAAVFALRAGNAPCGAPPTYAIA